MPAICRPSRCRRASMSVNATKRRCAQSAHFTFGLLQTPGCHSFRQRGAHPERPVLALCQRVANTSERPRKIEVNSATRPPAVMMSGPPAAASSSAITRHTAARSRSSAASRSRAAVRSLISRFATAVIFAKAPDRTVPRSGER